MYEDYYGYDEFYAYDGSYEYDGFYEYDGYQQYSTYLEIDEVAYLYEAGLGRQFDEPGLNYWIDEYEEGMPLTLIAESFLVSDEFVLNFGDYHEMSNATFVDIMYDNVLGRDPDAGGFAYWVEALDTGRLSEAEVLNNFAQSPENIAQASYVSQLQVDQYGYWDLG